MLLVSTCTRAEFVWIHKHVHVVQMFEDIPCGGMAVGGGVA